MEYPESGTQLLRAESEHGLSEMASRASMAPLRHLVRGYCLYREDRGPRSLHQHLPHPDVTLILVLDGSLEVHSPNGERHVLRQGQGFLAGIHTKPARTDSAPPQRGMEIGLTPLGAHLLLGGRPMHEVADRVIELDEGIGRAAPELAARLAESRGPEEPFVALDRFFADRLLDAEKKLPLELDVMWRWLCESHGRVRIGEIASEFGWSRKRLAAASRERFGHSPKTLARVLRFDRAMQLLKEHPDLRWTDAALACGYHDQAHLTREVRELADGTPAALSRLLLPETGGMLAP